MKPQTAFFLGGVVGILFAMVWMNAHRACPDCQKKWAQMKRKWGLKVIE